MAIRAESPSASDERAHSKLHALEPRPAADASILTADTAVQRLFALGLALTTALDVAADPAKAHIEEAMELVDQLVHDVHLSVFNRLEFSLPLVRRASEG